MNIGYLALGFAAIGAVISLIGCTRPQEKPIKPAPDYLRIYEAMSPKELF